MSSGRIVTVTGPIDPLELGPTDAHEHLFLETPAQPGEGFSAISRAEVEVEEAAATGLRAIVELTPIGLGRRADLLRQVSEATGVQIVAASGFHRDAHYEPGHWVLEATVDELAQRVVAELRDGIDDDGQDEGHGVRAGVMKGGASHDQITDAEDRRLRAIARASAMTGAPMIVHTEAATCGQQIVDLLLGEGAAVDRITLAHMDRDMDADLHTELIGRGVSLVYDTIGRDKYASDDERIDFIERMVGLGHGGSLMLGLDLGRRDYHRAWGGGPGLRHLLADFVPRLRQRIGQEAVDRLLVGNPRRVLAWS
jgi:phosphotriesterase-related protein